MKARGGIDLEAVRRIAIALPGVVEKPGHFSFGVEVKGKLKGLLWMWRQRVHPKKPRVPCPDVIAVRVRDQAEKVALLEGAPEIFFTEPHYDGYPAVLVRLAVIRRGQLRSLIQAAWRAQTGALKAAAPRKGGSSRRSSRLER